jgi:hypothetical protein
VADKKTPEIKTMTCIHSHGHCPNCPDADDDLVCTYCGDEVEDAGDLVEVQDTDGTAQLCGECLSLRSNRKRAAAIRMLAMEVA